MIGFTLKLMCLRAFLSHGFGMSLGFFFANCNQYELVLGYDYLCIYWVSLSLVTVLFHFCSFLSCVGLG